LYRICLLINQIKINQSINERPINIFHDML
jgi:hypothetical protein